MARAGVRITDYGGVQVNPEPIIIEEPQDTFLEDYISPTKLRALTGIEDLEGVKFLEMRVDTSETSLGNFGAMLPNLKQLKLNDSLIASVRDLGTALDILGVLWMARCCLSDLDGLSSMSSLQELYLAYNDVSDISPCSMLENLQLLDLEGNNVDDIAQVEFLGLCSKLRALSLEGNPVCLAPNKDYDKEESPPYNYRLSVWKAVPQLRILDDEVLNTASTSLSTSNLQPKALNLSTDWLLVNGSIKDTLGSVDSVASDGSGGSRPKTSAARPGSAAGRRPGSGSGRRPGSSMGHRPMTTAGGRPTTSAERPDTGGSDIVADGDDTSDLTHGSGGVICGNPVKALRSRRKNMKNPMTQQNTTMLMLLQHKPEHTYDALEEEDWEDGRSKEDIFVELRTWKEAHERKVEVRLQDLEPQVLKITHSDNEEEEETNNNLPLTSGSHSNQDDDDELDNDVDDDVDVGVYIPPTPSDSPIDGRLPTPPQGPRSPIRAPVRPKTTAVGDYRVRRFRQRSVDEGLSLDSSTDTPRLSQESRSSSLGDSGHMSPGTFLGSFPSSPVLGRIEDRPYSGPAVGIRTIPEVQQVDKNAPKSIDPHKPIIRSSVNTPPNRLMGLISRPVTARAALQRKALPSRTKNNPYTSM
ncbi:leucine-rich repeat-containing protein 56 [Strongylocentrotus purpuratus]|uniref:Leucine-rich repeat-containing protein 56 n=1 Tax=Strongylocentrotus purpuratus TaxID=7668 RepID=A0A7M7T0W4_STRPU|nr:leucine-rich repeat-containing protein 56 [Strongylocentrotus purpuratus]XP_030845622.1 leucine-rich repeat-containing protein 56 [Strongylocentrotus purpuratus]XP_030845623.1 leucine-rich repeat-containing protein 56 [Strongylocentrotus purpuratus]